MIILWAYAQCRKQMSSFLFYDVYSKRVCSTKYSQTRAGDYNWSHSGPLSCSYGFAGFTFASPVPSFLSLTPCCFPVHICLISSMQNYGLFTSIYYHIFWRYLLYLWLVSFLLQLQKLGGSLFFSLFALVSFLFVGFL